VHPFSFDYSKDEDGFEGYIKLLPMLCTLRADSPDPSAREGADLHAWRIPMSMNCVLQQPRRYSIPTTLT